ncbi:MAG: cytochrome c biogenesis protein CcsA [Planctomycetota bacterium]
MSRVLLSIVAFVSVFAGPAAGQAGSGAPDASAAKPTEVGPAGNAHPEDQLVTETDLRANPFGEATVEDRATVAQKIELARGVELGPLRDLAVFHNGRVKIVDTLARETVEYLTGRHALALPVPQDQRDVVGGPKADFDPLFTMLDLAIDPAFYVDKPLIAIGYLPLREAYLELAFRGDKTQVDRWKKFARVTPLMVDGMSQPIFDAHAGETPFREGITRAEGRLNLFKQSIANYMLIAPNSGDDVWHHVAEWPEASPVRVATAKLGEAWRAGDAAGVNAAVSDLASFLPTINEQTYPAGRRSLELTYNRANLFEWGYWAYLFALLALTIAFGTGRRWLGVTGQGLLILAVALHAIGFTARCVIAERFAIQNQFESMTGLSLFASVVGMVIMFARRQWLFGAASAATGFLVLIAATETAIPGKSIEREAAILNTSVLLKYHVTTVLTSYGFITLGMIISLFYLGTHYAKKFMGQTEFEGAAAASLTAMGSGDRGGSGGGGGPDEAARRPTTARTLADLDTAQMIILQLAFWTLGVGILLGAWWADHSWGRWWAFDPKETWALITWIVYLIVIHVRLVTGGNKALVTAWLSFIGFIVMLWTYFGVNLLLPGLHAYA